MASAYSSAMGCDARLNLWCDSNCPIYQTHGSLLARLDSANGHSGIAWRCYARSTLDAEGHRFKGGTEYCTRHKQLSDLLKSCVSERATSATVDARGATETLGLGPAATAQPSMPAPYPPSVPRPHPSVPRASFSTSTPSECCRAPLKRLPAKPPPHYVHTPSFMRLPAQLKLPRLEDCDDALVRDALFWAASLYTKSYEAKAQRLVQSCEAWGVCCRPALMPDGALEGVKGSNREGSYALRHRLIASKPMFILTVLQASPLPLAWLDVVRPALRTHGPPCVCSHGACPPAGHRRVLQCAAMYSTVRVAVTSSHLEPSRAISSHLEPWPRITPSPPSSHPRAACGGDPVSVGRALAHLCRTSSFTPSPPSSHPPAGPSLLSRGTCSYGTGKLT